MPHPPFDTFVVIPDDHDPIVVDLETTLMHVLDEAGNVLDAPHPLAWYKFQLEHADRCMLQSEEFHIATPGKPVAEAFKFCSLVTAFTGLSRPGKAAGPFACVVSGGPLDGVIEFSYTAIGAMETHARVVGRIKTMIACMGAREVLTPPPA